MKNSNTETYTVNGHEIQVFRINNDVNGNPRFVVHYLDILSDGEHGFDMALKNAKKVGGRVYRAKWFGGGIVFSSYNVRNTLETILK